MSNAPETELPFTAHGAEEYPVTWVTVAGMDSERGYVGDGRGSPFSQGYCPHCGLPSGGRTAEPLKIEAVPQGADLFEVSIPSQVQGAMCSCSWRQVFSQEFLEALTPTERASVTWQEVRPFRRSRKRFFELVALLPVPFVAKNGVSTWTWECEDCRGNAGVLMSPAYLKLPHFISGASVPAGTQVFAVGWQDSPQLCVSVARWCEISSVLGAKRVATRPVVALDADAVADSFPVYSIPLYEQLCCTRERLQVEYRDELLGSAEVMSMKADTRLSEDDVLDYIQKRLDDRLALPVLHRDHLSTNRS